MRLAALALLVALVAAAPAAATPRGHAHGQCASSFNSRQGDRLGPLSWNGPLDGYKDWDGHTRLADDGTYYAKNPMHMKAGTVASLSIGASARSVADWNYGFRAVDTVRLNGCRDEPSFFAGGLVVTKPVCVPITLRVRGSRQVYRRVVSIGMGDAC
jgi:hypothetical protein